MTVRDVQQIIEEWAPPDTAMERDNVGLQVGDPLSRVRGILVALDVTASAIEEAGRCRANMIVSHHPLLFHPLHAITPRNHVSRCAIALVRKRIALFSAHTNLDAARGGTSFALASALGLVVHDFLQTPARQMNKIVTFVPPTHLEAVAQAMEDAGAGKIGAYDGCSFRTSGTGTFQGKKTSHPAVGRQGKREDVPEVRIEMILPRHKADAVIQSLQKAHPYEEVAYDLYPLDNSAAEYGMGAVGELAHPVPLRSFLGTISKALAIPAPKYCGNPRQTVRRVAVCGGSGGDLIDLAVAAGADVFVTADLRYSSFHDAEGRIALVDAGHYETEFPVVPAIVARLRREFRRRGVSAPVAAARSTNPVRYCLT